MDFEMIDKNVHSKLAKVTQDQFFGSDIENP